MDELDIENAAIEISKDHLHQVPVPFLAHLRSNGGGFVIVQNTEGLENHLPKFFERWSGVVVLAEKKNNWTHEANEEWLQKDRKKQISLFISLGLLLGFVAASISYSFEWKEQVLLLIAAVGTYVSWMIVSKDLGIENKIADRICGKEGNCNAVIQSKGSRLPFRIGWSDVGIIYFSFLLFALSVNPFMKPSSSLYLVVSFLAVCSLPFTFFSIYYQWQVTKRWCRLCLIIVALMWAQFTLIIPQLFQIANWKFEWHRVIILELLLLLVASLWFPLKSLLKANKKLKSENFANLRFKNNPDLFTALLQVQRKVDVTPFKNDLQLGNPEADFQIMVACNPYCGPCAKAHQVMQDLIERNDIGLTIRFVIKTDKEEDKRLKATTYLLELADEKEIDYKRNLIHKWYERMDIEDFKKQHPLPLNRNVTAQLKQHAEWSKNAEISFTPTIFINSYELPKEYRPEDLRKLIRGFVNIKNNSVKPPLEAVIN